jgi:phosphoglycolate phosphatase
VSIRGVVFDLDGTIAHTLPDIAAAVNLGLQSFGLPPRPFDEVRLMVGEGLPTLCARAVADHPEIAVTDMTQRVTQFYREHRLDQARPFDGIPELMDALTARQVPMAVLTNKPHEHTEPIMAALFGRWTFVAIEGYREESRRKPDPRTALEIVALMGASPAEVMMVGDSKTDVLTGINAGMVPVGVTWGYRPAEELVAAGAKFVVSRPGKIVGLL